MVPNGEPMKISIAKFLRAGFGFLPGGWSVGIARYARVAVALVLAFAAPACRVAGQDLFQPLYSFTGGADGHNPNADLMQASDGNLYGTTYYGGNNGVGTVFRITPGGAYTSIYAFKGTVYAGDYDAGAPYYGALVQASDGWLYGATEEGGTNQDGAIYRISTNGVESVLYSFTGGTTDGQYAFGGLVQAGDGNLYGTTGTRGQYGYGTIYRIATNGAYASLYSFTAGNDGGHPYASLLRATDGGLYGTTAFDNTYGSVFRFTTNSVMTPLHDFYGDRNGGYNQGGLIQASDGTLYGTTEYGGLPNWYMLTGGTVYQISTNGTFKSIYAFTGGADGGSPLGTVVQASDGNLYGTTFYGGNTNLNGYGYGTVFRVTTNGAESVVYAFTGQGDGANPVAGLIQASDGRLYGTTAYGGTNGYGSIFAVLIPLPLNCQASGGNLILSWASPYFYLQAAPTVTGVFTNIPGATSPYTVPITGGQQFFRLTSTPPPPTPIRGPGGGPS